jgi:hypothetical protein
VNTVKEVLHTVLNEELIGKTYDAKNVGQWSLNISDIIKEKVVGKSFTNVFSNLIF